MNALKTTSDPDSCRKLAADLLSSALPADTLAQISKGGLKLDELVSRLRGRSQWLQQFGGLLLCCGEAAADHNQDLPIVEQVHPLLETYENGLGVDSVLDGTNATIAYLWLKSYSCLGQNAAVMQALEALYQRWAAYPLDASTDQSLKLLLSWLGLWGMEACELIVLEARQKHMPGSVIGQAAKRRQELRRKLIHRVCMPERSANNAYVGYRHDAGFEKLKDEAETRISEEQVLPVFLLSQPKNSSAEGGVQIAADVELEDLLKLLAEEMLQGLPGQIQSVVRVLVEIDLGGMRQAPQPWLQVIPLHAERWGLKGASVWLCVDRYEVSGKAVANCHLYGGVDPSGMTMESFLRVVKVIKDQHEQELAKMLANLDHVIASALSNQSKRASRVAFTSSLEAGERRPV